MELRVTDTLASRFHFSELTSSEFNQEVQARLGLESSRKKYINIPRFQTNYQVSITAMTFFSCVTDERSSAYTSALDVRQGLLTHPQLQAHFD